VRHYLHITEVDKGRLLAIALVMLVWALPVNADTLRAHHAVSAVAPDRLFDASLLVPEGQLSALSTETAAQPEDTRSAVALARLPFAMETLNISAVVRDDQPENAEGGVRRFILLAILLGAAIRFLTSPAFYRWAADIFNPLDWS
jgi:hypothetical protein